MSPPTKSEFFATKLTSSRTMAFVGVSFLAPTTGKNSYQYPLCYNKFLTLGMFYPSIGRLGLMKIKLSERHLGSFILNREYIAVE